ncbi:hypothetical protein AAVH_11020, partial [Aphelenchoides avenae]
NVKENAELTEEQKQAVISRLAEGSPGAAAKRVSAKAVPTKGPAEVRSPAASKRTDVEEKIEDDDE